MDTVRFIEERNRMCKSFNTGCKWCPAFNADDELCCCAVGQESTLDATAQVAIVEKWSTEHPRKTKQDIFLEQWPETKIGSDGILSLVRQLFLLPIETNMGVVKLYVYHVTIVVVSFGRRRCCNMTKKDAAALLVQLYFYYSILNSKYRYCVNESMTEEVK